MSQLRIIPLALAFLEMWLRLSPVETAVMSLGAKNGPPPPDEKYISLINVIGGCCLIWVVQTENEMMDKKWPAN